MDAAMLPQTNLKPVYTVSDIVALGIISKTGLYAEHRAGRLKLKKRGRRTFCLAQDLHDWLASMPCKEAVSGPHSRRAIATWQRRKRKKTSKTRTELSRGRNLQRVVPRAAVAQMEAR